MTVSWTILDPIQSSQKLLLSLKNISKYFFVPYFEIVSEVAYKKHQISSPGPIFLENPLKIFMSSPISFKSKGMIFSNIWLPFKKHDNGVVIGLHSGKHLSKTFMGDPLSPYLFVICMDRLSHIIADQMDANYWKPMRAGQKINNQKTQIFFSKNVDQQLKSDIVQHTGYTPVVSLGKYLGANIDLWRSTRGKFNYILEKIQNRLSGWKHQCLSMAGRLTLSKFVLSFIPYYHMHWEVCCLPKVEGGLAIKRPHQMNEAFLMKILWIMINCPDDLWSLAGIGDQFRSHTIWKMGNGQQVNFWLDKWMTNGHSLMNHSTQQIVDTTLTVKYTLTDTGEWDINFLTANLPLTTLNQLASIPAPKDTDGVDSLGWSGTNTRHFTVQSAYNLQPGDYPSIYGKWKRLWSWKLPHRIQTFMWIAAHKRLLTNYRRRTGFLIIWKTVFMVACWYLWTWRNKSIFEDDFRRPNNPTHVNLKMAMEIDRCEQTHLNGWPQQKDTVFISWKQPREGWIKLNCDGAHKSSINLSGYGGLLRDNNGICISSFARKISSCDALHVEMWGMYNGIDLARRHGITHLQVESDSKVLVEMVTRNCNVNENIPTLLRRIRDLIKMNWDVQINHTWREGNKSVDWLANYSLTLNSFDLHVLETPPRELQSLLFYDFSGNCMPRNVRLNT
ncbi:hypothetical protein TSUD_276320 [Trifolium subterraneum]|uniref:RNase H type-1 domain-containing protein n=1 Tax=Trifolium subterraneum TaxID=3900 RepID=A0A2Z6NPK8_TRISU|nr:hypothetical protein TSUD_276320 [Trifolium subterraneum]